MPRIFYFRESNTTWKAPTHTDAHTHKHTHARVVRFAHAVEIRKVPTPERISCEFSCMFVVSCELGLPFAFVQNLLFTPRTRLLISVEATLPCSSQERIIFRRGCPCTRGQNILISVPILVSTQCTNAVNLLWCGHTSHGA